MQRRKKTSESSVVFPRFCHFLSRLDELRTLIGCSARPAKAGDGDIASSAQQVFPVATLSRSALAVIIAERRPRRADDNLVWHFFLILVICGPSLAI